MICNVIFFNIGNCFFCLELLAAESGSLVKDASVSRMDEESKMNEEEAREEYKRSLAKGDSKRVSFSE